MGRYVLADKARKDLVCNLPGQIRQGKLDAASRRLEKHGEPTSSPLLLAFAIELCVAAGEDDAADEMYRNRDGTLGLASEMGPDEITEFFVQLFTFHLGREDLGAAESVFVDGVQYGVDHEAYGLLWAKYNDMAGNIEAGLECLDSRLPRRKRFTESERQFLAARYPTLAGDPRFESILDRG